MLFVLLLSAQRCSGKDRYINRDYSYFLIAKRRQLLAGAIVATISGLAGCSGSSGDSDPTDTAAKTETSTTPTATETSTPISTTETVITTETATTTEEEGPPSLDEFAYSEGATRDGIDSQQLSKTHESAIGDAGSATLAGELTRVRIGRFTVFEGRLRP